MTKGNAKKLFEMFPGAPAITVSRWSDDEQVHVIFSVEKDGTLTRIGCEDSTEQVIYFVTDRYGFGVVIVFDGV